VDENAMKSMGIGSKFNVKKMLNLERDDDSQRVSHSSLEHKQFVAQTSTSSQYHKYGSRV
jgi:hypothetical protein